jgi:hypothetical protein
MDDYFLAIRKQLTCFLNLESWRDRLRGLSRIEKIYIILAIFILVLCMRLFFYNNFDEKAYAETINLNEGIDSEVIDPMNKIDKGIINPDKDNPRDAKYCDNNSKNIYLGKKEEDQERKENKLKEMIGEYPMKKMIPFLAERDEKTAAFLVAIAKKESGWGEHAPSKSGRDCYNYWGYKGNYRLVLGYSCFDSPEQAIKVVGDKIDQLIAKKIDTPSRMVVWKCGSSCAGHDPEGVRSWIGTVESYMKRLVS